MKEERVKRWKSRREKRKARNIYGLMINRKRVKEKIVHCWSTRSLEFRSWTI